MTTKKKERALVSKTSRGILVSVALLPHLDLADRHLPATLPCRIPLVTCIPEILLRRRAAVDPGLAGLAVLEPAVRAADGHVEDEIKFLIKGCLVTARLGPDVDEARAVGVRKGKVALLPERLVEVGVDDLEKARIDIGEQVLLRPF